MVGRITIDSHQSSWIFWNPPPFAGIPLATSRVAPGRGRPSRDDLMPQDEPRQSASIGRLDVVGYRLAGGQVTDGTVRLAEDGEHAAEAVGLVELGQDQAVGTDPREPLD